MKIIDRVIQLISDYVEAEVSVSANELTKQLFEAGAHYGHPTRAWHPQMKKFIYDSQNKNHIIDIRQTISSLIQSLMCLYSAGLQGKKILFVCTDPQMFENVSEIAVNCGQYYVSKRWRGGLLTNWSTTQKSLQHKKDLEQTLLKHSVDLKKKERLSMQRQIERINKTLGGIETLACMPDIVIISNLPREKVAVQEIKTLQEQKLPIKSIGIVDTNANPNLVDYPIPSNDDSVRILEYIFRLMAKVIAQASLDVASGNIPTE